MEHANTICGICGTSSVQLEELSGQEQVLVEKLFKCISLYKQSRRSCHPCLRKLYNFKNFLKEIIVNQVKLVRTHEKTMQGDSNKGTPEKHTNLYNCKCSECQKKFGSLPLLVDVIENAEKNESNNPQEPQPSTSQEMSPRSSRRVMKCAHCDKTFTHKGDLNKHLRRHTGEQPFTCSICDRKFAHTSNLARHVRLHSGDRPFICEVCKKNFSRKDKLDLHRRSKSCKRRK